MGEYSVRCHWRVINFYYGRPENANCSLQSSLPDCSFYIYLWTLTPHLSQQEDSVTPNAEGEVNAGAAAASSCGVGAGHSTGGFSGGSSELLSSGGFCGAATACQHLLQRPSLGRLLGLGIVLDHSSLLSLQCPDSNFPVGCLSSSVSELTCAKIGGLASAKTRFVFISISVALVYISFWVWRSNWSNWWQT